jgi:hypothetical protein
MMANTDTKGVQAVQKWFKENNVDPQKGMQTLQSYARFMGMSHVPLDKILPRFIKEAKSGSVQAAVAHGADPDLMRASREYTGNAAKDLENFRQNPLFSDEEIKRYEKAQKIFSHISDSFERLKVGAFTALLLGVEESYVAVTEGWKIIGEFGKTLKESYEREFKNSGHSFDIFPNFSENLKDFFLFNTKDSTAENKTIEDQYKNNDISPETQEEINRRINKIRNEDAGNSRVNVVNNFNITSGSPEDVAAEVQKSIDRAFFEKEFSKSKIKPATVF